MDPPRRKIPRLRKPRNVGGTNINDLPNELLEAIISDLPTKAAVRTSVLSTRWEHIWKGITKLELEEASFATKQMFIEFVEKLFELCKNTSRLTKLSLQFEANDQTDERLNKWLHEFINPMTIQELSLDLDKVDESLLVFPENLFKSETLTKFQLTMPYLLKIPSSVYWRCLKDLTLKYVIFPDGQSGQRLLAGCQVLEELALVDCNWSNVRIACIACPMVRKLKIREWKDEADITGEDENENNNNGPPRPRCRIVIVGNKNMTYFGYDGDMVNDYYLYCAHSVLEASLEVHPNDDFHGDVGLFVAMLLTPLKNVQTLTITQHAADGILNSTHEMVQMPVFNNLKDIRVTSSFSMDLSSASLLTLLRNSPILESIIFITGLTMGEEIYEEFSMDPLPACLSSHLMNITWYYFRGEEGELNAIKYLLRVAPLLQRFFIYSNMSYFEEDLATEQLDMLYDQIVEYPRASQGCYLYLE